jgi:hypothetical protein
MSTIAELAKTARASSEADWGTARQIDAENTFFDAFHAVMGDTPEFDDWCLKATSDEMISKALTMVEEQHGTLDVEAPAAPGL